MTEQKNILLKLLESIFIMMVVSLLFMGAIALVMVLHAIWIILLYLFGFLVGTLLVNIPYIGSQINPLLGGIRIESVIGMVFVVGYYLGHSGDSS